MPNIVDEDTSPPSPSDGEERSTYLNEGANNTPNRHDQIVENPAIAGSVDEGEPPPAVALDNPKHSTPSGEDTQNRVPTIDPPPAPTGPNVVDKGKTPPVPLDHQKQSTSSSEGEHLRPHSNNLATQNPIPTVVDDVKSEVSAAPDDQKRSKAQVEGAQFLRPRVRFHLWFKRCRETWIPIINLGIGMLAFFVIAFQAMIYTQQKEIMNKQSIIMEKSFRVSTRAYVVISEVKLNLPTHEIVIMLNNNGHVPAGAIRLQVQDIRATEGNGPKGTVTPWNAGEVELLPGTTMPVVISLDPFEETEMKAISEKKEILYIRGMIHYDDGFGQLEKTTFAFQYIPSINSWVTHSDLSKLFKEENR